MLGSLITSKTRLRLLIKFFVSEGNRGYLRGIAEEFDESTNAIRKELNQLAEAGYLVREEGDKKIYYRANSAHSLFGSLQGLIRNFLGVDQIIEQIFERTGDVDEVALLGDYAEGIDSGHIELLISGNNIDSAYLLHATAKAEQLLEKKISIYLTPLAHTKAKIILFQKEAV